ncbi:GFA family protein [Rhodanobacter sp. L36]|uniref:GFA family protein n=1 Tax=Rhodanobacter sp. L36 TaxID=1747221 RepID=UPI00131BA35C|nr:GFA family protein [Rhodanobacter sp. L36]
MIEGSCRCGAVHWQFDGEPGGATACNCTSCRRYGVLWIYDYENEAVRVSGATQSYSPGTSLTFHFCPTCGCLVCWRGTETDEAGRRRMGVNIRLCEPEAVAEIPIDHFDGLVTFEDQPRDGKCVADYWY